METQIISPWLVYSIGLADMLLKICTVIGFPAFVIGIVSFFLCKAEKSETKYSSIAIIVGSVLLLLSIIIPSEKTIYAMIIAQNVTYERLEKLGTNTQKIHKTLKKDVVDIIKEIQREAK